MKHYYNSFQDIRYCHVILVRHHQLDLPRAFGTLPPPVSSETAALQVISLSPRAYPATERDFSPTLSVCSTHRNERDTVR